MKHTMLKKTSILLSVLVLLVCAGMAYAQVDGSNVSNTKNAVAATVDEAVTDTKTAVADTADAVGKAAADTKNAIAGTADEAVTDAKAAVADTADAVGKAAADTKDAITETADEAVTDAKAAVADTADAVGKAAADTKDAIAETMDEAVTDTKAAVADTTDEAAADTKTAVTNVTTSSATDANANKSASTQKNQSKLTAAIASAIQDGKIDSNAKPGFLGIPGAPNINPFIAFFWALWVGWIFSTVGAFGGVMAGVGHMSVFGLGNYASSFGKKGPYADLNKGITDSIRVSNQWLVGCSALISSFKYSRMGRIVLPLGIALGLGGLLGSWLIPKLTQGKLDFQSYQGYFGIFVLALGCYLLYETTPGARAKKQKAAAAAKAFEEIEKSHVQNETNQARVKILKISPTRVAFTFCGVEFSFNPIVPILFGFLVAAISSFLGVGGGFLVVPFLTSACQLPMYLAAGTSALYVLVSMITAISSFMTGGAAVHWPLIGLELVGIVIGSWIGPMTTKYFSDAWLKRLFIVIAFLVGIDFILKGFYQKSLWALLIPG